MIPMPESVEPDYLGRRDRIPPPGPPPWDRVVILIVLAACVAFFLGRWLP
jgi:hypothetical protein